MGGKFSSITDNMVEKQKQLQVEMVKLQLDNQILMQDRMMKKQIALQMAMTKERTYWFAGFVSFMYAAAFVITKKEGKVPKILVGPAVALTVVTAYQYDMAFLNKMNRIKKMADEYEHDPSLWIHPIQPLKYPTTDTTNTKK
ncbi:hypothetical protein DLAC_06580 [Tieghemostelium lacteum]|uniref:Plasminogen receptor (KT) n=1 Tax=Tieghemostelium lacteum TaxID=361077 RepID=A0A151ZF49_TIELA|nr:hypothetical protein DLAC_06580 [Tieghemostelium lacteum]|eukprot:KYQ92588.1 hypothetical protein DLAC_06580 [Tieghemostelium lacteum]